jgi:hypothetical protein
LPRLQVNKDSSNGTVPSVAEENPYIISIIFIAAHKSNIDQLSIFINREESL